VEEQAVHTASIGMSPSHFVTRIFGFFICDLPSVFLCRENWHSLAGCLPSDYIRFQTSFLSWAILSRHR
jgi:hypothetical protein